MGALKTISIVVVVVFFIMIIVTNQTLRDRISRIASKKIFKTRILVKDILAISSILVILGSSIVMLRKTGATLSFLIVREKIRNESQNEVEKTNDL